MLYYTLYLFVFLSFLFMFLSHFFHIISVYFFSGITSSNGISQISNPIISPIINDVSKRLLNILSSSKKNRNNDRNTNSDSNTENNRGKDGANNNGITSFMNTDMNSNQNNYMNNIDIINFDNNSIMKPNHIPALNPKNNYNNDEGIKNISEGFNTLNKEESETLKIITNVIFDKLKNRIIKRLQVLI